MDTRPLQSVDLNLLLALQVLLEERHVSRAAERLHITQPAMSKTLTRLRRVFDDALLTRTSHGMQPTPRAEALAADLRGVLEGAKQLLTPTGFSPAHLSGEVTLAMSEFTGLALLPHLVTRLQVLAPRLTIKTITRVDNQLDKLASGDLDFAIHLEHAHYGPDYQLDSLGSNPMAVLARRDHPLVGSMVSWDHLVRFPVIRLYISDLDQAEVVRTSEIFQRIRNPQLGSFETSHLLTALEVLRQSDHLMPAPSYLLRNTSAREGIVALPLPGDVHEELHYMLVSHHRVAQSPLHIWLRQQILETLASLREIANSAPD